MEPAALSRPDVMAAWEATHLSATTEERDHVEVFFDRVLLRGDEVLMYVNTATTDPRQGDIKLTSYGSDHALLPRRLFTERPRTLPDTPGESNWAYELAGWCDGQTPAA